jgi:hypothetical protein
MALRWARARAGSTRLLANELCDDRGKTGAQRGAVGRSAWPGTTTLGHDTVQPDLGHLRRKRTLRTKDHRGEESFGARLRCFLSRLSDVFRRFGMLDRLRQIVEDARRADNRSLRRIGQRHLYHFNAEQCRIRILGRLRVDTTRQFIRGADPGRTGDIDVDVLLVLRILEHRVRVRAAAGLHVAHVLRCLDVRDIKDADAAQAVLAHRFAHTRIAAIEAAAVSFAGDEQQVPVDRHIALRCRAVVGDGQRG